MRDLFEMYIEAEDSDLDYLKPKILALIREFISENKERFKEEVKVFSQWSDDDPL